MLRLILKDFGIACDFPTKGELLSAFAHWLKARYEAGDCPVIVIDEAHALTGRALEEICMLLNLESGGAKLVQIVLAGQPLLDKRLRLSHLAQLRQRVMRYCQLSPLTLEETTRYMLKRLAWAGLTHSNVFPQEVVREIFRYSKGIPRLINLICEHALLSSYADRRNQIEVDDVVALAQEFELDGETEAAKGPSRRNRFSGLIPFPKSTAACTKLRSKQRGLGAALMAAWLASEQRHNTSVLAVPDAVSAEPVRAPVRPRIRGILATSPIRSLLWYWRAVRSSLAHDSRRFFEQCFKWLNKPMERRAA